MARLPLACLLLIIGWWQSAYGWGDEGHRITGHIANALLSDAARQQLRQVIGTDDLSQVATWMDDNRPELEQRLPGSSRWHFENRAACNRADNAAHACPRGNCITQQIERSIGVIKNAHATRTQRAEAVRILVHLLGDLHQPLHLIDNNDRGGNDLWVLMPREREPRRLHEVWDTRLVHIDLHRRSEVNYARILLSDFANERPTWQRGNIEQWASESYALGLRYAYQALPGFACRGRNEPDSETKTLSAPYLEAATTMVETQLAKAGARIAWVLNKTLNDNRHED